MIGLRGVALDSVNRGFTLLTVIRISGRYKWCRHGFLTPSNGGGVSPCTKSAVRMLIGRSSVVVLFELCGAVHDNFVPFRGYSLLIYTYVAAQGVFS